MNFKNSYLASLNELDDEGLRKELADLELSLMKAGHVVKSYKQNTYGSKKHSKVCNVKKTKWKRKQIKKILGGKIENEI